MKQVDQTLVVLTPGFPENERDSNCLPAQQLFILALNKNFPHLKLIIISFQYPFTAVPYEWHHNAVIPLNGRNKKKPSRLQLWVKAWRILKKINNSNHITGIFSFWCTECALVGQYFGKRYQLKHYNWILGQDARKENRFIQWIKPGPENLVAMSDFLCAEFYKNHSIKPGHIIPNGIDPALFHAPQKLRDIDILGAGSLIPLKQYDLFTAIVKELTHAKPSLKALLCGDGPEYKNLDLQLKRLELDNNMQLAGEKKHDALLQIMQRTKVFLHTSSYEGFSSACLEALYAGAHVISFCNPITGGINHWHIVSSREEMLKKAIELLQNPDTDYSPVLAFSMDDTAKAVMDLFEPSGAAINSFSSVVKSALTIHAISL